jgi:hypothetical protein
MLIDEKHSSIATLPIAPMNGFRIRHLSGFLGVQLAKRRGECKRRPTNRQGRYRLRRKKHFARTGEAS